MPNRENQNDILGWNPPIFCDVARLAARKNQFPSPVLCLAAEQGMVSKQLKRTPYADDPLARRLRIMLCEEIEESDDMRSIAAKLGVANLLEGSVRKIGRELRITAQLIRA